MRRAEHAIRKIIGNEPFVVIGKHQRVEPLERGNNEPQKLFLGFLPYRFLPLAVHAHHLLVPRDDAGLHCGDALRIRNDAFAANPGIAQTPLHREARLIAPEHSKRFHPRAKRRNVGRHIPRSAEAFVLLHKIHYRHGRFRRQTRGRSP